MSTYDVGPAEFSTTSTEEHHDGAQAAYGDDIQWIGCYFYDRTNPIVAGPGSAWSFSDTSVGLSNLKIRNCVAESWRGGGVSATTVQGLKVLQSSFGNEPGSNSNSTTGDTVVVDLSSPGVAVQTQFVALAPPQPFLKQGNSGLLTAYTTATNLLGAVCNGGVAVHMTGSTFGMVDQNPSAGVYVYTSSSTRSLYLGSTSTVRWAVKTGFDAVAAAGASTDRTLIVFGSESWKNGGSSDGKQFYRPDHFQDAVDATIDALLAGATNNGGVKYWSHVSVWNEMKSRVANGLSTGWESDATLNPDTTTVVTTSNWLSNFAIAYTQFYNLLFDAIKAHANPIVNTVQVGGPHYAFGGVNPNPSNVFNATNDKNHRWPLGSPDGTTWGPWNWDYDCFVYWLKWSHGFDFISIDYSLVDNNDSVDANTAYIVAQRGNMGNLITKVKALRDTYAGMTSRANARADGLNASQVLALKRAAPVDHIEYYWDVNLSRCDTNYTEDVQAMQEALVVREMFVSGVRKAYKWMPEGQNDGTTLRNLNSWYRAEYTSAITSNSSSGLVTNTGSGTKYLAYDVVKLFKDNFPVGTQLYSVTCSNPNVVCMASAAKVYAINTSAVAQSVTYSGLVRTLPAYGTAVYSATTGTPGVSLSDIIIDSGATNVTLLGVNARSQYYSNSATTETRIDKNFWRTDWDRAGTNAKTGAVSFVSSTDLHLSTPAQDAATGGPLTTDDADVLAWDTEGRGHGPTPAIGAYASPAVTSPLFAGAVTVSTLVPETFNVTAGISGLSPATTYHYRVSTTRLDGSGGTIVSADDTFTTGAGAVVTTPAAYGPTSVVTTTTNPAGAVFVVKSDGQIYDSTGTTLQNMTAKDFSSLVTIKSDTAGTRRTLNPSTLTNCRFSASLIFTEVTFNDPTANFEVKAPSTTYGIDFQGCSGRLGHFRVISYAHNGVRLTASAAPVTTGATGSTWDTAAPDLRLDNWTAHAAGGADGSAVVAAKARNVILGGFDPGFNSTATGLSGPAFVFNGSALDDVQDVIVGNALDGTQSYAASLAGTYTFHLLLCRRSGWQGSAAKPVIFPNTLGSRPEKPAWLGSTDVVSPGAETSVNTTNAKVVCDYPIARDGLSQNLVTYTFRNGATGNQAFEVDHTVWDPAAALSSWTDATVRFVDPRQALGVRPTGATAPVLVNKTTITSAFVIPGGATGSVTRSGDNWFEIRGMKIDPGTVASPIWTDAAGTSGAVFITDTSKGIQVKVAAANLQPGGVMPSIPLFPATGLGVIPTGGASVKVTSAAGGNVQFTNWPTAPTPTTNVKTDEHVVGIYTNIIDPNLGANAVESGIGYRRQLGYTSIDAATGHFNGVFLIPGPSGGNIAPDPGDVLTVSAATPGVVTTFFPHGLANNEWVTIAGNTQPAANGQFKITRLTPTTFSLQTTAGVNVAIPAAGSGGTYTSNGLNNTGYTYGLIGTSNTITLVAGATFDCTQNDNLGQPKHNAQLNIGSDAVGKGIRFIGCDFHDVSLQAASTSSVIQLVDCQSFVTDLPGQGIDHFDVDNAIRGTYDSNNQHAHAHMIGSLNMIAPGEAFWQIERCLFTNAHGDMMPGKFALGSTLRHSHLHHARDGNNTSLTASCQRGAMPPFVGFPKVAQGPHGDQFQNYDRNNITVVGCDLHSNGNNSIFFSQKLLNYAVFTSVPFTNSGGHYLGTKTGHNFNTLDMCRIDGTGDTALDGKEFLVTSTTSTTFTLGTTTYIANRTGTATHVIHQTADFRRNDMRIVRHFNRSDLTEVTSLTGLGNKTYANGNVGINNLVTNSATFLDNRLDYGTGGGSQGWIMDTAVAGSVYDFGTPNRNFWRTGLPSDGIVPGGVATPH